MTRMADRPRWPSFALVFLAPLLHLVACVVIQVAGLERGWEQMIKVDFPFSILLVALTWRLDVPVLWFGALGTLWWYIVSWTIWRLFRVRRVRASAS